MAVVSVNLGLRAQHAGLRGPSNGLETVKVIKICCRCRQLNHSAFAIIDVSCMPGTGSDRAAVGKLRHNVL